MVCTLIMVACTGTVITGTIQTIICILVVTMFDYPTEQTPTTPTAEPHPTVTKTHPIDNNDSKNPSNKPSNMVVVVMVV